MPTLACISALVQPLSGRLPASRTWLNLLAALRPFKPPNEDHRRRPTAGPSYRSSKESLNGLSASPTAFSAPGKIALQYILKDDPIEISDHVASEYQRRPPDQLRRRPEKFSTARATRRIFSPNSSPHAGAEAIRNSGGTDEATSAVQRIDNTGGAAGGFRVKCGRSASASSASAPAFHPRSSEFSADGCDNPWTVLNMGMD